MLVSKIKPCMCNYSLFDGIYYSDNRSNSRANTCNKPRLLEGMHLLDKRSTQALPVALMIHDNSSDRTAFVPATHHSNFSRSWTLGWVDRSASGVHRSARPFCRRCAPVLNWPGRASGAVTLKKLECSKQDSDPIVLAFGIGVMINRDSRGRTTAKAFAKDVFINQERKLGARRRSDTVLVSTINDADQGSADVAFRTPLAPYEKSKSLGSGGSMVARLKLKGIDGRAPPGVEPALFLDSMGGGAWPFLVGGAICLVNSVNERDLSLLNSYVEVTLHGQLLRGTMAIIAIVGLQRGIPSKRESSARVDYVPALCTHRPSLLPIEWSGEVFGLRRRERFAARDVNVAKCDTWCELQNPVNHRVFERKLRPKPLGRGHACLGVTHRFPNANM
uniref:Uncharacterized protein n=1 Tax=Glycine max TaxID=3847 RepID=A0A0R0GH50_SOYBN